MVCMDVIVERIGIGRSVGSRCFVQDGHVAFQVDPCEVGLCGAEFGAREVNLLALLVIALNRKHVPIAGC